MTLGLTSSSQILGGIFGETGSLLLLLFLAADRWRAGPTCFKTSSQAESYSALETERTCVSSPSVFEDGLLPPVSPVFQSGLLLCRGVNEPTLSLNRGSKVWSSDQQHQHHQELTRNANCRPHLGLLNGTLWELTCSLTALLR